MPKFFKNWRRNSSSSKDNQRASKNHTKSVDSSTLAVGCPVVMESFNKSQTMTQPCQIWTKSRVIWVSLFSCDLNTRLSRSCLNSANLSYIHTHTLGTTLLTISQFWRSGSHFRRWCVWTLSTYLRKSKKSTSSTTGKWQKWLWRRQKWKTPSKFFLYLYLPFQRHIFCMKRIRNY